MATEKTSVDLDLDALAPKVVRINYKGKIVEVKPLELTQYAKLLDLAQSLASFKGEPKVEDITGLYEKIATLIKEVIPDFAGETLNQAQLTAIFNLLCELNTPQDKALAELEKHGVNLHSKGGKSGNPKG